MSIARLAQWLAPAAYPLIILGLLGCGVGLPLSEDLLLVAAGYLAGREVTALLWTFVVCYPSVLAGDILLYEGGRRLDQLVLGRRRLRRLLSTRRRAFVQRLFDRWGVLAVAVARQIMGVRSPAFVLAGVAHMPRGRFIITDALAACVAIPAFVLLGYFMGKGVGALEPRVPWLELALLGVALAGGGLFTAFQRLRERRR
ncbi:MAG: DedA family protein [Myxococcales bacterium]